MSCHVADLIRQANITQNLPRSIGQAKKDFWSTQVFETVLTRIDQFESEWLEKVEKLCARWCKYNSSGFSSFLRHEGAWKTAKCPRGDWNQEMLDIMEDHLRPALDHLCDKSSMVLQEELTQNVSDILDQMGCELRAYLDTNQHTAFAEFFENVRGYGKDVEVTLKQVCKEFAAEIP